MSIKSRGVLVALTLALTCCLCSCGQHHTDGTPESVSSSAANEPAPGTVRANPKDGLRYARIPPGTFMMGCSPDETHCNDDEKPPHPVTITKGFWLGQTEVTVAAYKRFAGSKGAQMPTQPVFNEGWKKPDMPIVNINWEEATAYCGWAGGRLPTKAEWEYAARAGSTEERYGPIDEVAWYIDNSAQKNHDVAQKRPNAWNLYDTLGNVFEWVNDWYGDTYYPASPGRDPRGPHRGKYRVIRGGSWYLGSGFASASNRTGWDPAGRDSALGVRCAREVDIPAGTAEAPLTRQGQIKGDAPSSAPAGESKVKVRVNPKDGLKYVWIPPGSFQMGCSPGDSECLAGEKPAHQVTITKGFWLGQTEVTVAAYSRYAGSTGTQMPEAPNFMKDWKNQDMPMVEVSWNDAAAFCGWAGGRLPSEAEWEYAARAGSTEALYGPIDEVAWYLNNSGQVTQEVSQMRANGFGLFDILGNVEEWVNDWYDENYYQRSPSQDPAGPASGKVRVLRGACYAHELKYVRVSFRDGSAPAYHNDDAGFRCGGKVFKP